MSVLSRIAKSVGLFLILISLIAAYGSWEFAHRYQIESEVLNGYKNDNRKLVVVLSKELENERPWGSAQLLSRTFADRLQQRGYSVQLVESETAKGRSSREKTEAAAASTSDTYDSSATLLTSQALARAAQIQAGILLVYLSEVTVQARTTNVRSESYGLELFNSDRSPAWKATLTHAEPKFGPLFYLLRYSSGDPAPGWEEELTDETIVRMQQQGVLK